VPKPASFLEPFGTYQVIWVWFGHLINKSFCNIFLQVARVNKAQFFQQKKRERD